MEFAIVFGGRSYEHEISIVSAIALREKIEAKLIFLDREGDFYLIDKEPRAKLFSSGEYKKMPRLELKKGGFYQKGLLKEKRVEFDVAINLVHGAEGEDGHLAALFDFFEIAYIGPRVEASVMSFNKLFTKMYAKELGCNVLEYQLMRRDAISPLKFSYPVIVKPLRLGSSIGVSVVKDESELSYALDVAFEFDDEVLIEPFIEGIREFNLAGAKGSGGFIFSKLEEVQKGKFLDFEKKYMDFARDEIQEASLPDGTKERFYESFKKVYDPLFAGAIIRIDFFFHNDTIYINEINPVPGSLAAYLFENIAAVLNAVARSLPKRSKVDIEYRYINSISAKK
ncbi:MAG: D-alanine--D-alanine ligase [Epsilonproteobacteria bacterium]|nr:D-alanine--D-alanine ligase [Campylobacterota bacterium]NPA64766.1 D-alanine--D-alanine ligase [Campylobacterota bacterium]